MPGETENIVDDALEPAPSIAVQLFGPLVIRRDGTTLTAKDLGGCKPRHILEILLLSLGKPVSKVHLIEMLWGHSAGEGAVATLESYVSGIRRAIQPGQTKTGPLRTANSGYLLDPGLVDLDLSRFAALLRAATLRKPDEAYPLLVEALELSAEPLLGFELAADWADDARTRHAAERVGAMIAAAETASVLDRHHEAVRWAQLSVQAEPLNERAWTALVTAYERAGLPAEGLTAYERCRRRFDRDLACTPGPALQAAHLRLLRQRADANPELSEVLAALLYLGERLSGAGGRDAGQGTGTYNGGQVTGRQGGGQGAGGQGAGGQGAGGRDAGQGDGGEGTGGQGTAGRGAVQHRAAERRLHEDASRILDSFLQRVRAAV
ncbi:BTAD domain-containing putative transcriptional regulator [Arthrobacter sp. B3I4]|uniref:AfsR/SARP family transcriptional regulator n=1 Tax=Arthrobacter sp. B3I4 TaxID=3042267 RepID=UPI0027D80AC8|nr:BTAD domain-containing putative transcriptional regulator [Arthrobacter sp. B3I4]